MAQMPKRRPGAAMIVALGLIVAMLVMACGSSATPSPSAGASGGSALDGRWILTSYTGPGGVQQNVPAAILPDITFDGNAARGNAGCNTFTAIAVITDKTIHFDQVQSTKVQCPEPGSTIEAAYLQALALASQYTVTGDTLVMNAPGTQPTSLTFVRATS